tara:strand:+ start:142 stop:399 length:258 start_codon:yes stop_codon:yes gene_type:complete
MSRAKTPFCMLHPDIAPGLKGMVPLALKCVEEALVRGRADRAAVDTARWVLATVSEGEQEKLQEELPEERKELMDTLQLLRGGRK